MSKHAATHVRPAVEHDTKVTGLHIRHGKARSAYYLYYRTKAGKERRPKLGDTKLLTLTRAREIALEMLRDVATGGDPIERREQEANKTIRTMQMLRDEYDKLVASVEKKARTRENEDSLWERHILPHFKPDTDVRAITRPDVVALKSKLRDKPATANRAIALVRHAFNQSELWGWRDEMTNPVRGVKLYAEEGRQRMPSIEEARRLFDALDRMRDRNPWFAGLIALLCLTGARRSEIQFSRREWWQGHQLVLPDSKTGAKIIPVNTHAQAVVASIPKVQGNPYLIVGRRRGAALVNAKDLWAELLEDAEIENLRMHDLRRFFASIAVSSGRTLEQTMQLMGHTQAQTSKRYAFLITDAKMDAMQATGDQMALLMQKKAPV